MPTHPSRAPRIAIIGPGLLLLLCACHGGRSSAPQAGFSLSVAPAALSIPAGGGGFATVTVTRTGGFTDAVALQLDGAPAGLLASGTVPSAAPTGQLAILVARDLAPQTLEAVRVRGTAAGMTQTGTFSLVVAPPLPVGPASPDLVQANGGVQRSGLLENTGVACEPFKAGISKDPSGTLEARHGFTPSAKTN